MSNETVRNGTARASVGKIARLPKDIRERLNCRLDDGQPASEILPWVNGLPAAIEVLAKYFGGVPISEKNLSEWRHKGYERWRERQEAAAELKELAEDMEDFSSAAGGKVARIAVAKILRLLNTIPAEQASVNELTKISHAISALLHAEQSQVRLEYEKTRVFQGNERLVLSWDKFLRDRVATAQRALKDAICKDIEAANIDNSEKIELMGHHMFGKKWQGRKVGKKQAPKQEPEGVKKEVAESAAVNKAEDQQVRPTTAQGQGTEPAVSPAGEKVEGKEANAQHVSNGMKDSKGEPDEMVAEKAGMNITGSLTTTSEQHTETALASLVRVGTTHEPALASLVSTATIPVVPPNPKQKPPAREAQAAPVKNVQPKPQVDPSVPKPSPWDAFSEPVQPSPFASFHGMLRPDSWKNKLG